MAIAPSRPRPAPRACQQGPARIPRPATCRACSTSSRRCRPPPPCRVACAGSYALRKLDDAAADHRQLAVLVARLLLDLHQVAPVLHELPDDRAVDAQRIALGV